MIRPIYAYEPIVSVTYPIRNVTLSLAEAHTIKKEKNTTTIESRSKIKKMCECETRICKMKLIPEGYTFTHYQCLMAT